MDDAKNLLYVLTFASASISVAAGLALYQDFKRSKKTPKQGKLEEKLEAKAEKKVEAKVVEKPRTLTRADYFLNAKESLNSSDNPDDYLRVDYQISSYCHNENNTYNLRYGREAICKPFIGIRVYPSSPPYFLPKILEGCNEATKSGNQISKTLFVSKKIGKDEKELEEITDEISNFKVDSRSNADERGFSVGCKEGKVYGSISVCNGNGGRTNFQERRYAKGIIADMKERKTLKTENLLELAKHYETLGKTYVAKKLREHHSNQIGENVNSKITINTPNPYVLNAADEVYRHYLSQGQTKISVPTNEHLGDLAYLFANRLDEMNRLKQNPSQDANPNLYAPLVEMCKINEKAKRDIRLLTREEYYKLNRAHRVMSKVKR